VPKKIEKKPTVTRAVSKISEEQKKLVLSLINHSKDITNSVMDVGSAMVSDCLNAQNAMSELAKSFGWKQDSPWSDWK
jgi:Sec7-like guanine-nucleotide exchange factor